LEVLLKKVVLSLLLGLSVLPECMPQGKLTFDDLIGRFRATFGSSRAVRVPVFVAKEGCFLAPVAEGADLSRILVLPRYALPLDVERDLIDQLNSCSLSDVEYAALVDRVRSIVPLGAYVRTIDDPTVTSSRSWDVEEYEGAYIKRAYGNEEDTPRDQTFTVRAYIYVPHAVEGAVERKHTYRMGGVDFWVVTIDEKQYWVKESDYLRLRVGRHASVVGFGPLGPLLEER